MQNEVGHAPKMMMNLSFWHMVIPHPHNPYGWVNVVRMWCFASLQL
jgi:hypothetical protein